MRDFRMDILRNGVPIGRLLCKNISIRFDANAEVMRGMQAEVFANRQEMTDGFEWNMFSDRLQPVLIEDGVESSLGRFMIIAAPENLAETGNYYNIEAYDETMLLKQAAATSRKFFNTGTAYMTAIEQMLTECGFANVIRDESSATMQISREFAVGTTYLEIINTFLEEMNYNPVHTDVNGYVVLTAKEQRGTADFVYRDRAEFKLVGTIERDMDIYEKPNVLVGVISNPQTTPTVYTRENTDPASILSIYQRGYKVVKVYKMNNMASQADLEAFIDAELLKAMQTTETVNFETLAEAGHEFGSTVQLATDLIEGLYTETFYQIDIAVNRSRMRHKGERRVFI